MPPMHIVVTGGAGYIGSTIVPVLLEDGHRVTLVDRFYYWTCATLTPGSVPGNTISPANSEIIAPISQVEIGMGNWPGSSGGRLAWGPSVSFFDKWQNMGILYAGTVLKADAVTPSRFQVTKALSTIVAGAHTFGFVAKDPGGNTLLEASISFTR